MDERCEKCGRPIPNGRLEALPNTRTCVGCSEVEGYTEDTVDLDGADRDDLRQISRTPEREKQ